MFIVQYVPGPEGHFSAVKLKTRNDLFFMTSAIVRIRFLCFRLAVMSLNWVVITMCFYGLSLNSANNEVLIFFSLKITRKFNVIIYFEKSELSCERLAQNRGYLGPSICRNTK
jgi:hypothetical protein